MQIGEQIRRSVNKRYKRLEIEIDGVFVRLMLLKKKKYAAMKVVDWQNQQFEAEIKGLDIVRRDWCGLAKDMGEAILMRLLDTKSNHEESVDWIHEYLVEKCKEMDDGKVNIEKFIITKGLTKDPKDYPDAKNQPHVQVALRLLSRGKNVRPGQEVGYVICNTGANLLAERARDPHDLEMDKNLTLDVQWYKKQQVHPLITRILAVVEGTSPGRIAECLGMDVARFSQVVKAEEDENGEDIGSFSSMGDDFGKAIFHRFKDFTSKLEGFKCKCGTVTRWSQFLVANDSMESTESKASTFYCPGCQTQVNMKLVRNLWFMQYRRLVKEHSEGWTQVDDGCIEKTRRSTRGQNLVSEKTVRSELEFASHICERAKEDPQNQEPKTQDTIEKMNKDAGLWLGFSSLYWVDCKDLFSFLTHS
eukprot:symbB.v1.2.019071.t1/scaffold1542.1/size112718/6